MKRLFLTLLIVTSTKTYDRAPKSVPYYSKFKHELVRMSQSTPEKIKWFRDAQEGNLNGIRQKYFSVASPEDKLLLVNASDRTGRTALMHAAGNGRPEVVRWLIGAGADQTKTNYVSINALEGASRIIKYYKKTYNRCYSGRGVDEPAKFHKRMVDTAWRKDLYN